jgi:hypothetical protein
MREGVGVGARAMKMVELLSTVIESGENNARGEERAPIPFLLPHASLAAAKIHASRPPGLVVVFS